MSTKNIMSNNVSQLKLSITDIQGPVIPSTIESQSNLKCSFAIIGLYGWPSIFYDMFIFDNQYKINNNNYELNVFYQIGKEYQKTSYYPNFYPQNIEWATEIAFEVEYIHSLFPFADINLIIASNESYFASAFEFAKTLPIDFIVSCYNYSNNYTISEHDTHFVYTSTTLTHPITGLLMNGWLKIKTNGIYFYVK